MLLGGHQKEQLICRYVKLISQWLVTSPHKPLIRWDWFATGQILIILVCRLSRGRCFQLFVLVLLAEATYIHSSPGYPNRVSKISSLKFLGEP